MTYFTILIASFTCIFCINSFAHETTRWDTDWQAYRSVHPDHSPTHISPPSKKNALIHVNRAFFEQKLKQLAGAAPVEIDHVRTTILERGSASGRADARKFLRQEFEALGFKTMEQNYRSGANFVAEKPGKDTSRVLILTAHLDSVSNAGANDDGSGIISFLTIASALAQFENNITLRMVGFDQEEKGLVGSKAYVSSITGSNETVIGDINLEMIMTNKRKDGKFHVIDCDRPDSKFMTTAIASAIKSLGSNISINKACTDRSDHASFWDANMPAVVISENFFGGDSDSCYHKKCDIVDSRLDFDYAMKITDAVANATVELLNR